MVGEGWDGGTELARDIDTVRGRSGAAGAEGARLHPNKDVRIAVSEGSTGCKGVDGAAPENVVWGNWGSSKTGGDGCAKEIAERSDEI